MFVFDLLKIADIFKIQKKYVFDFINNDVHNDTFVLITHTLKDSIFQRLELQNLEWTRQLRWCKNIEPVLLWHHLHKLSLTKSKLQILIKNHIVKWYLQWCNKYSWCFCSWTHLLQQFCLQMQNVLSNTNV